MGLIQTGRPKNGIGWFSWALAFWIFHRRVFLSQCGTEIVPLPFCRNPTSPLPIALAVKEKLCNGFFLKMPYCAANKQTRLEIWYKFVAHESCGMIMQCRCTIYPFGSLKYVLRGQEKSQYNFVNLYFVIV